MSTPGARARARAAFVLALAIASSSLTAGTAGAVADEGSAFKPTPMSEKDYAVQSTPTGEHSLTAADGTELVLEYWLPIKKEAPGAHEPPNSFPVIVFHANDALGPRFLTPAGESIGLGAIVDRTTLPNPATSRFIDALHHLVPRGYAVVYAYGRGTGRSGGCLDFFSNRSADDGSRIIEWAGTQAWSTGDVGMYGLSSGANHIWATALSDHPERTKYLKAIVPMSGFASMYDAVFMDGAPNPLRNTGVNTAVLPIWSLNPPYPEDPASRRCNVNMVLDSAKENSGDFSPYWQDREHRDGLHNLRAATLLAHGLFDPNVATRSYMGLLDRWPQGVPLKMVLGAYAHSGPDQAESNPDGRRKDWLDMLTAWYDRWLKGMDTGVEDWPAVQVQDSNDQWRQESDWVGRPRGGALALSAADSSVSVLPGNGGRGVLGAMDPQGETTYFQGQATGSGGSVSFTTPPLAGDLRIYGDPILDVSLKVSDPDAKVGVRLDVVNPEGQVRGLPYGSTYGARSMRHLDPLVDGRFAQESGSNPILDTPFRTTIRLNPTDMLVPQGWRLRLSFFSFTDMNPRRGGGFTWPPETVWADGSASKITILHNCPDPTVLRFAMATKNAPLVNALDSEGAYEQMASEQEKLKSVDGGRLATSKIC